MCFSLDDDTDQAERESAALLRVARVMAEEAARLPFTSPVAWELMFRSDGTQAVLAEAELD